jgi:hypothetical protein
LTVSLAPMTRTTSVSVKSSLISSISSTTTHVSFLCLSASYQGSWTVGMTLTVIRHPCLS